MVGIAATGAEALRRVRDAAARRRRSSTSSSRRRAASRSRAGSSTTTPGDAATVILISTHAEDDLADLIAESPAIGFLPKSELSAAAIRGMLQLVERSAR